MSAAWLGGLLAGAVLLAWARLLWRQHRAQPGMRMRGWRLGLLLAAQPLCAGLLYCTLQPPPTTVDAGTLTVLTAGAYAADAGSGAMVALPEADAPGVEPAPDLATALRRHPQAARLRVLGDGLAPRDREAVAGIAVDYAPPAPAAGIVALAAPAQLAPGEDFRVHGRAAGAPDGSVELLDPAGRSIARARLGADGVFALTGAARAAGAADFALRLRDADDAVLERLELPLWIEAPPAPKLLLLAGAPGPEPKYLRRWAVDAGLDVQVRYEVGAGVALGDPSPDFSAQSLRGFDLAIVDERAWAALGDARRQALVAAVRDGLGLLLRASGPLPASTRAQWRALGFDLLDAGGTRAATAAPGPATGAAGAPALLRRDLRVAAADAVGFGPQIDDVPAGWWRVEGRGRIALWTIVDSYRWVLAGYGQDHAALWSQALATATRTLDAPAAHLPQAPAWVGERMRLCGLADEARALAPDGAATALLVDPAAGPDRCAGYWPRTPGWHRLQQGGRDLHFHVYAADVAPGLRAAQAREATLRLAAGAANAAAATTMRPAPGASWPWFLAWLAATGLTWWLERSRVGRGDGRNTTVRDAVG